ncbi:MAG: pyridoxal-phosphate dependent enzyme, partial [Patescibacteria group bacterium]
MRSLFQGKSAITDFLNPRNHPSTPLVELPESLTPGHDKGVRIYCKMMTSLPLMNVKSLAAYEMLAEVDTEKTNEIVEASSGNTAYSVAMIANSMGISNVTALVSKEVTPAKLKL